MLALRSWSAVLVALVLFGLALPRTATAQVPLLNGFGGTAGYGTSCLGPNDDGSSRMIDLTPIFPTGLQFFDRTHTVMFVNNNGNVTFGAGVGAYTPSAFPIADQPMIAPFWADVDTRPANPGMCGGLPDGTGTPMYNYAGDCLNPSDNGVWWHLDVPGRRVIVTWDNVGFYRCHPTPVMNFQLVITAVDGGCGSGGGDFDVEFRFNTCEWNTGDASGGINGLPRPPAACVRTLVGWRCPIGTMACTGGGMSRMCTPVPGQSGFDAGNTMDFVEIMGSRTATIHTTLCTMSNVADPGVWRFQIRQGGVICPDAGDPCTIPGTMGACAMGRTNCVGAGTECVQQVFAETERCDNLDNDCNGMADDGGDAFLCGAGFICRGGACVENCFESFCGGGLVCVDPGVCVEPGCETVMCPEGERCSGGACVPACSGVTCPAGQMCTSGRCIDPCAGITCDDCTVCDAGTCVARCTMGAACGAGESCDATTGGCVASACVGVTCGAGTHCEAGACVDSCAGVSCPIGQECLVGACVGIDRPDAGPVADTGPPRPDAGPPIDGGPAPAIDGGTAFDAGRVIGPPTPRSPGCGCRVPVSDDGAAPLGSLALAVVLGLIARRRR